MGILLLLVAVGLMLGLFAYVGLIIYFFLIPKKKDKDVKTEGSDKESKDSKKSEEKADKKTEEKKKETAEEKKEVNKEETEED